MKNVWSIIAVACIVAGCVVAHFSSIAIVDYSAIAVMSFGFVTLIINTIKKADNKGWKEIVGVLLFAVAGGCCAVAGIAQDTMSQLITLVAGLITLIAGLITISIKKK